jgi:hypothetical protein
MVRVSFLSVLCGFALAHTAVAVQPKTASELHRHCENFAADPAAPESRLCVNYIAGFLDGAVVTDARVAENVAAEIERSDTFTERATGSRIKDYGPSVYAEFCVGRPVPIEDVVSHVMEELEGYELLDDVLARSVVYASLRRAYPCVVASD